MTEEFVSEVKQIPHNDERIFTMLSDLSNLERIKDRIPQDKLKITVRADLNPFLKPMVSKPLQEAVDKISTVIASLPY